ncbi:GHMP kinase [Halanaerobium hydrogeniformans]|uniref:GHMP kinase n=1 Tax=Halanaerobium hydrogeniformans TaxID=656519 RepID=E4RK34_HALHG|nr:GHMP kinase [Halanaerobium hydrogeniformans]ADQ15604.1 GHMP kinase [Halanaerobium hydrogeniformans]
MQGVRVRVPGSCGELIQGSIDGNDFLVSCPINLYSRVNVHFDQTIENIKINKYAPRTQQAVELLLKKYELPKKGIKIDINTDLINAAGMASSTADITASLAAIMILLKGEIDINLLTNIAIKIEPSDSVFLDGLHIFNHRSGKDAEYLGEAPEMDIMLFKEPGLVDSLKFNKNKKLAFLNKNKEDIIKKALSILKKGIREEDCRLIGKASTLSSFAHQHILPKKSLAKLVEITDQKEGIYGVNIAHSGTLIGILVAKNFIETELLLEIKENLPELKFLNRVKLISGGIEMRVDNGTSSWRKLNQSCKKEWV